MPDPETTPVAEPVVAAPLPDNLDVGELLELAATQSAPRSISMVEPPAEDADDDDDDADGGEEDGAGTEEAGEGDATGAPAAKPEAPTPEAIRAAGDMIAAAPQRINELPRGQRAGAVQEAMKLAYARGATDTFTAMQADSAQTDDLRAFVTEQDGLREDDPEAFRLWEDDNPEEAARYMQGRAFFAARSAGKPATMPGAPKGAAPAATGLPPEQQIIQDLAIEEMPRLSALPAAQRDAIRDAEFPLTPVGLRAFRKAISDAEAEQASAKPRDPAAVRRQENAVKRDGLARPQIGRGQPTPPNKNPLDDITSVDELLALAQTDAARTRAG